MKALIPIDLFLISLLNLPDKRLRACSANKVPIVTSEGTGLAELNLLPLAAGIEKIQLPPGTYPFTINSDIVNCTVDVKVIGECHTKLSVENLSHIFDILVFRCLVLDPGIVIISSLMRREFSPLEHRFWELLCSCQVL